MDSHIGKMKPLTQESIPSRLCLQIWKKSCEPWNILREYFHNSGVGKQIYKETKYINYKGKHNWLYKLRCSVSVKNTLGKKRRDRLANKMLSIVPKVNKISQYRKINKANK